MTLLTTHAGSEGLIVYASGSNRRGQLGQPLFGDQINQFAPIAPAGSTDKIVDVLCSWHNTVILTRAREEGDELHMHITGDNKYG